MGFYKIAVFGIAAFAASAAIAHVPPPPSQPGQDELAGQIVKSIEGKDRAAYSAILAPDVRVYEDGKEIASNRDQWLEKFGKKLVASGVSFKVSPGYSSAGRLLFIEYYNSAASWGEAVPRDCCWSHDAVAYDVAAGKIVTIRRLRGGDRKIDEAR